MNASFSLEIVHKDITGFWKEFRATNQTQSELPHAMDSVGNKEEISKKSDEKI